MDGIWTHKDGMYVTDFFGPFEVTVSKEYSYGWSVSDEFTKIVGKQFFKSAKLAKAFAEEYYA